MTENEKIQDATNRVLLGIQSAALYPDKAKIMIADYGTQIREYWEGYFTALFANSEIEHPNSEITK